VVVIAYWKVYLSTQKHGNTFSNGGAAKCQNLVKTYNVLLDPLPGRLIVVAVSLVWMLYTGDHICQVVSSAPSARGKRTMKSDRYSQVNDPTVTVLYKGVKHTIIG
jgi:hypothetical protein